MNTYYVLKLPFFVSKLMDNMLVFVKLYTYFERFIGLGAFLFYFLLFNV